MMSWNLHSVRNSTGMWCFLTKEEILLNIVLGHLDIEKAWESFKGNGKYSLLLFQYQQK